MDNALRVNKLLSDFEINDKDFTAILGATYSINDKNEIGIENYFNNYKESSITKSILNSKNHSKIVSRSENLLSESVSTKLWYSSINYTYNSDDKTKLSANVEVGEKLSDPSSDTQSVFDDDSNNNSHLLFDSNAKSNYLITKFDFIHKFQKKWKIELGVQNAKTIRENVLNNFKLANNQRIALNDKNQDFDNNENILGFYTSLSKTYKSHFIKLGGRVEYTNIEGKNHINQKNVKKDYINFFPWVYYKYSINPKNTIYFMAKRSITRPSFKELNPYVIKENDFLFNVGNPNIQPEFKIYSELGYAYKKHYLSFFIRKRDHVIKTRYFHDDNYITYSIDDNFGKSTETGVDYYYNGYINKWLYLSFSAGLSYNYFKSDDDLITKGISSYNNIFFNISLPNDWNLSINNSIHPKFHYLNLEIQPQNKFDIEIKKSFLNKKAFISLKCNDVFNTRVDENLSYYKDFTSYYYSKPITRNFILKIQYNIDNNKEVKSSSFKNQNNENRGRL
ncbi:hypothetical protein EDM00_03485 [Ornithobacterium rhinotracheale]|uniref:outer membrane beta-barrel family protein n=1 Tax=Ornithobacterium rhinotracheale TaxID=28251 RepID=UPI00129CAB2D|nr:outer membrane beta-barrel family protein [Ornithobacterium rhinotracheale]MRI63057.1 hypothetical protein [Ornithobacterium rhinotracheale]